MVHSKEWFEADKQGLAQLSERRGKAYAIPELLQNAWDESVTDVVLSLSRRESDKKWVLTITDDSPEGFTDLRDAFTLFKSSKKKGDPEKRGRFNLGEKLVLSLASEATITTTTGQVVFNADGRTINKRTKRPTGTCVQLLFTSFSVQDAEDALTLCQRLIPPTGVKTYVQPSGFPPLGRASFYIEERVPVRVFEAVLPTEIDNGDGALRRTNRKTRIEVYEADGIFVPGIYELGIPVVDTDDKYVVNIAQKVPLNLERDNVTPAYLRQVRTLVANETADLFTAEDTTQTWVAEALADDRVEPEVVQSIITSRFGKKVVAFDPSDLEANKLAAARGYTVLYGRTFSKDQWENIRNAEAVKPAGQVTPSPAVLSSPDGIPPLDPKEWTEAHHRIADYAKRVHQNIVTNTKGEIGVGITVSFQHKRVEAGQAIAWYGNHRVTFNIYRLGKAWLTDVTQENLDALLIHEYGHYYSSDHLSSSYYDALCGLGARLRARSKQIGSLR